MGQQGGILGLRGTIGGLVFAKDGTVRQKPASNKAGFQSKASMARTRENASEFGGAGSAGKVLRDALRSFIQGAKDRYTVSRLSQLMNTIIKMDSVNGRGARQVLKANAVTKLPGFNFNQGSTLSSTLFFPYTASRAAAIVTLDIPSITPNLDLTAPQGATHFELVYGAVSIDFSTGVATSAVASVAATPVALDGVANTDYAALTLTLPAAPGASDVVVAVMGVNFYQEVNGQMYPINNNASNPLAIVYAG
jgi:hypothetical protein